jgi:DNA-binding GntR family transcriptional regulator
MLSWALARELLQGRLAMTQQLSQVDIDSAIEVARAQVRRN